MNRTLILPILRVGFALLTLVAIAIQAAEAASRGVLVPANYLSYFTIQSNVIGAAVFLVGAARLRSAASPGWDLVRGASVLNLTVTFVVFAVLLSGTDVDVAIPWVNDVVHGVFPLAVMADWLIDPPGSRISFSRSLRWLAYPLAWLGYTMVRGPIAGWYPYPFLDPATAGYGHVALYVAGILVFGTVLAAVISTIGNALRGRRTLVGPGTDQG
jgi:hypothetical protein